MTGVLTSEQPSGVTSEASKGASRKTFLAHRKVLENFSEMWIIWLVGVGKHWIKHKTTVVIKPKLYFIGGKLYDRHRKTI